MRFTLRRMMAIVAGTAGAFWFYNVFAYHPITSYYYPVVLRVRSASSSPIRSVTFEAFGNEKVAAKYLKQLVPPMLGSRAGAAEPFTGQDLPYLVYYQARHSPLGRLVAEHRERIFLVIVTLGNSRRVGKLVPIPHKDETRIISVEFP